MNTTIEAIIVGAILTVLGYLIDKKITDLETKNKQVSDDLDKEIKTLTMKVEKVEERSLENKSKIELVDNNHIHLNNRFDLLYEAVKDLTIEIKNLSLQLSKKKDI